jgi:hypothetical protein
MSSSSQVLGPTFLTYYGLSVNKIGLDWGDWGIVEFILY